MTDKDPITRPKKRKRKRDRRLYDRERYDKKRRDLLGHKKRTPKGEEAMAGWR